MLEPVAYVEVSDEGYEFTSTKYLPNGEYPLFTLPDLLAAQREPSEEMLEAALDSQFSDFRLLWQAMLSAFERQMEGEK